MYLEGRYKVDTYDAIVSRRSIRSYTNDVITEENLERILTAAEAAPIARALYDKMHITVITNPQILEKIDRATAKMIGDMEKRPLYGAPMLVVISEQIDDAAMENPMWSSAACMVENMALEAVALGVGSVHIWGAIRAVNASPELLAELELPDGFVPSCAIALGQTEEEYVPRDIPENRIKRSFLR